MYHDTPSIFPPHEVYQHISPNKTLFIQKLSEKAIYPEIVAGLQTEEEVFEYYKPFCDVRLDKENGYFVIQRFTFRSLPDFDIENLINQSPYLKCPNVEYYRYSRII